MIAPKWSGHVDFLLAPVKEDGKVRMRNHFTSVDFDLNNVQKEAVWEGVIQADSQWCFIKEHSVRDAMRKMQKNYGSALAPARKLKEHILEEFKEEKQIEKFIEIIFGFSPQTKIVNKNKEPQKFNSISFCISTNGKKESITKMQIKSILNNIEKSDLRTQIILCGDIENFKNLENNFNDILEPTEEYIIWQNTNILEPNIECCNAIGGNVVSVNEWASYNQTWVNTITQNYNSLLNNPSTEFLNSLDFNYSEILSYIKEYDNLKNNLIDITSPELQNKFIIQHIKENDATITEDELNQIKQINIEQNNILRESNKTYNTQNFSGHYKLKSLQFSNLFSCPPFDGFK